MLPQHSKMIFNTSDLEKTQTLDGTCLRVLPSTQISYSNEAVKGTLAMYFLSNKRQDYQALKDKTAQHGKPDFYSAMHSKTLTKRRNVRVNRRKPVENGVGSSAGEVPGTITPQVHTKLAGTHPEMSL